MKNKIVADASAILALINNEAGAEIVEEHLSQSIVSSINFSEVLTIASRNGFDEKQIKTLLKDIYPNIIDFNYEQAVIAASIDKNTKKFGLSLGDRSCLALAKHKKLPALTANQDWLKLNVDIAIKLIR